MKTKNSFIIILQKLVLLSLTTIVFFISCLYIPLGNLISIFNIKLSIRLTTCFSYCIWRLTNCICLLTYKIDLNKDNTNNNSINKDNILNLNKYYLIISNHTSASDFMILNFLFLNNNLSNMKYVIKSDLKYFLGFFQIIKLLGFISVQRNNKKDEHEINKSISTIIKKKIHANIVLFPEGARFTEKLILESNKFCIKKNLPVFKNVLYPRFKGFELLHGHLKESHINDLVDVTIVHNEIPLSLWEVFFTSKTRSVKVYYKIDNMVDVVDPRKYLMESFIMKDALIDQIKNIN